MQKNQYNKNMTSQRMQIHHAGKQQQKRSTTQTMKAGRSKQIQKQKLKP